MCVCVCVCVCVCMCVCVYVYVLCVCVCVHACIVHVCMYVCMHTYMLHFKSCITVLIVYLAIRLLSQDVHKQKVLRNDLPPTMTQFFSVICICFCLTTLSITKDCVYITSSQQTAEHEKYVEVVRFKLLSQHLPGETQQNNEATSASESVSTVAHDSN